MKKTPSNLLLVLIPSTFAVNRKVPDPSAHKRPASAVLIAFRCAKFDVIVEDVDIIDIMTCSATVEVVWLITIRLCCMIYVMVLLCKPEKHSSRRFVLPAFVARRGGSLCVANFLLVKNNTYQ